MKETITIGAIHKEEVIKKLEKFKQKCLKYVDDPNIITYSFSDNYRKEYTMQEVVDGVITKRTFKVIVIDLTINYELIRFFNDYKVIAKVEKIEEGKNIVDLYDMNYDFYDFDNITTECQHCKTNKRRKYIYVLEHKPTLNKIQVGKSCLQEYMNDQDVLNKLSTFDVFKKLIKQFESLNVGETHLDWNYITKTAVMDTDYFLGLLIEEIEKNGLVKSSIERSTIYNVFRKYGLSLEDKEKTSKIIQDVKDYFRLTRFRNDFGRKIQYLLSKDIVRLSDFNVLIYAYPMYQDATKILDKKKNQEEREKSFKDLYAKSEYQGEIGELLYIDSCKLIESKRIESCYGVSYLYTFVDEHDNLYTWFSSNCKDFSNDTFCLRGRIKDHTIYNEIKQTQLTRCKVL